MSDRGELHGNGALQSDDHDAIVRLEAAVDELRRDVGEDSREGIRGKLNDHIKICGERWQKLEVRLEGLEREIKGMARMFLWACAGAAFLVTTGLVILGFVLKR